METGKQDKQDESYGGTLQQHHVQLTVHTVNDTELGITHDVKFREFPELFSNISFNNHSSQFPKQQVTRHTTYSFTR